MTVKVENNPSSEMERCLEKSGGEDVAERTWRCDGSSLPFVVLAAVQGTSSGGRCRASRRVRATCPRLSRSLPARD